VQRLERAVETAMDAQGSFVAVNNHVSQSEGHLRQTAEKIRAAIET
jgi:ABC-type transporter Mla subunit MlaD